MTETAASILRPLAERRVVTMRVEPGRVLSEAPYVMQDDKIVREFVLDLRFDMLRHWGHVHLPGEHGYECLVNYADMKVDTSLGAIVRAAVDCQLVTGRFYLDVGHPPDGGGHWSWTFHEDLHDGNREFVGRGESPEEAAARALVAAVGKE